VHVRALADARQDPHFVEPRPTLMQLARDADLFVEVGLQLELWAEKVVAGSGNPRRAPACVCVSRNPGISANSPRTRVKVDCHKGSDNRRGLRGCH